MIQKVGDGEEDEEIENLTGHILLREREGGTWNDDVWEQRNISSPRLMSPISVGSAEGGAVTTSRQNPPAMESFHDASQITIHVVKPVDQKLKRIQRLYKRNLRLQQLLSNASKFILDIDSTTVKGLGVDKTSGKDESVSFPRCEEESIVPDDLHAFTSKVRVCGDEQNSRSGAELMRERYSLESIRFQTQNNLLIKSPMEKRKGEGSAKRCEEELRCNPQLEAMHRAILSHVESWSLYSPTTLEFIRLLEDYKILASKYVKSECQFENAIKSIKEKSRKCKMQQRKLGLTANATQSKLAAKCERKDNDALKFWRKVDSFLMGITPELVGELDKLSKMRQSAKPDYMLNMYAINRLAALLKMLKYCEDANIDMQTFKETLIQQGNVAAKYTSSSYSINNPSSLATPSSANCSYYPAPHEYEYLLSLDMERVGEELFRLRSKLLKCAGRRGNSKEATQRPELELELDSVAERTRSLWSRIKTRMLSQRKVAGPLPSVVSLERKYQQLVPAMKRRKELELQRESGSLSERDRSLGPLYIPETGDTDPYGCSIQKGLCYSRSSDYSYNAFLNGTHATPSTATATPPAPEIAPHKYMERMRGPRRSKEELM